MAAAPSTTTDLLDLIRRSGLLTPEALDTVLKQRSSPPSSPSSLASYLVKTGSLTSFQAKMLLSGKHRGFRLGAYILRDQIGQGGMGAVYLAEHETLRRRVAIKVLSTGGTAAVDRLLREARSAAALDHPNIVHLYDIASQGPTHYLVMEYVDGQTLDKLVADDGPLPCSKAVEYAAQTAAGLQHAFEKGFVHRDIKPANLMLARDGTVKILDMGLARSPASGEAGAEGPDHGTPVGTADYISPEQAMSAPDQDIRADIYSLGATFFTLVVGRPPFDGNTTQKLLQHQIKTPPSLSALDPSFPKGLAAVVARMLAKRPDDRYATPAEVVTALAPWMQNSTRVVIALSHTDLAQKPEFQDTLAEVVGAGAKRSPDAPAEVVREQHRPRRRLAAVGLAAFALIASVGVIAALGGFTASPPASVAAASNLPAADPKTAADKDAAAQPTKPRDESVFAPATLLSERIAGKSTQQDAAVSLTAGPSRAATAPPVKLAADGNVLFTLDLGPIPEFDVVIENGKPTPPDLKLPFGMGAWVWKKGAVGAFRCMTIEGAKAIGVTNLNDAGSAQYSVELETALRLKIEPEKQYRVTVGYLTANEAKGFVEVMNKEYKKVGRAEVVAKQGWQVAEVLFTRPADSHVRLVVENTAVGEGNTLFVKSVDISPAE